MDITRWHEFYAPHNKHRCMTVMDCFGNRIDHTQFKDDCECMSLAIKLHKLGKKSYPKYRVYLLNKTDNLMFEVKDNVNPNIDYDIIVSGIDKQQRVANLLQKHPETSLITALNIVTLR